MKKLIQCGKYRIYLIALQAMVLYSCQSATPTIDGLRAADKIDEQGTMTHLRPGEIRAFKRNGLLNVHAQVINPTNSSQTLFYRFKWIDSNGLQAWEDETWKPLLVQGGQKINITSVAPIAQAVDFRIEMHSPENNVPFELFKNTSRYWWEQN